MGNFTRRSRTLKAQGTTALSATHHTALGLEDLEPVLHHPFLTQSADVAKPPASRDAALAKV
jgi:hypothetical protein